MEEEGNDPVDPQLERHESPTQQRLADDESILLNLEREGAVHYYLIFPPHRQYYDLWLNSSAIRPTVCTASMERKDSLRATGFQSQRNSGYPVVALSTRYGEHSLKRNHRVQIEKNRKLLAGTGRDSSPL